MKARATALTLGLFGYIKAKKKWIFLLIACILLAIAALAVLAELSPCTSPFIYSLY